MKNSILASIFVVGTMFNSVALAIEPTDLPDTIIFEIMQHKVIDEVVFGQCISKLEREEFISEYEWTLEDWTYYGKSLQTVSYKFHNPSTNTGDMIHFNVSNSSLFAIEIHGTTNRDMIVGEDARNYLENLCITDLLATTE